MPIVPITDLADSRLDIYRSLNKTNVTRYSGEFVVEGHTLVDRLLQSEFAVASILSLDRHAESLAAQAAPEVPIYTLTKQQINEVIGFQFHRGVLACAVRKSPTTLRECLDTLPPNAVATVAICPQILDPTNLGSLIRNCCAMGVDVLLLGPHSADPFSRRAIRVSMGGILKLPTVCSLDLQADLQTLRQDQFELVATVLDDAAEPLPQFVRTKRTGILFGAEGPGLAVEWIEWCQRCVTLPMRRETDSLNLATAAGIFLYHLQYVCQIQS
ncbi:MAG: RNA methyltransferase [Pirellulaceae bacterium]